MTQAAWLLFATVFYALATMAWFLLAHLKGAKKPMMVLGFLMSAFGIACSVYALNM